MICQRVCEILKPWPSRNRGFTQLEHGDFLRNDDDLLVMMISEIFFFGFLQFLIASGILWILAAAGRC